MFRKAQQTVAHQSTLPSAFLGNRDLKSLQEVINTEKDYVKSSSRSAQDFNKTAEAIRGWGQNEGDDLQDILGKLSLLFEHYAASQARFNSHLATIRQHFKAVRTREESLAELRSRKRSLGSKIESVEKKLHKMSPENKELPKTTVQLKELRAEMDSLRAEVAAEEAAIGDYKRRTTRDSMSIKCAGLLEFAEKMTIVGEMGKLMIEEIPLNKTQPGMPREEYRGAQRTDEILRQATQNIADVPFAPAGSSGAARQADMSQYQNNEAYDDSDMGYYDTTQNAANGEEHDRDLGAYEYDSAAPWAQQAAGENEAYTNEHERDLTVPEHQQSASHSFQHDDTQQHTYEDVDEPHSPTPIYASHSASSRNRVTSGNSYAAQQQPQQQVDSHDSATAQWTRSQAAASGSTPATRTSGSGGSHPIADKYRSRSPEEVQVGGQGLRIVDNPTGDEPYTSAAPRLATPRLSTPPPQDSSLGYEQTEHDASASRSAAGASIPVMNVAAAPQDDDAYFQNVGSTRAAQQAMRRPMSPGGNTARQFSSTIASGGNEGQAEGRKMTAAAFRKGFGRAPASQQGAGFNGSTTSLGAAIAGPGSAAHSQYSQQQHAGYAQAQAPGSPGVGSNGDHLAPNTAPLAIRKRQSSEIAHPVPGEAGYAPHYSQQQQQDGPAPPYDGRQPQYAQQPGFPPMGETRSNYAYDQGQYFAPPQPHYHTSEYGTPGLGPNSRPTSAAGWRQ